jgi:hypothetical protein
MKRLFAIPFLAAGLASSLLAQTISVELLFDQEMYLPHERMEARVRVTNFSGHTLELGEGRQWLTFTVDGQKGAPVSQLGPLPVEGEFRLESSSVATRRVNLAPYFDFSRPGRYKISATVRVPQFQLAVHSPPKDILIITGSTLWEQDFGVPPSAEGELPEIRKYTLLQTMHHKEMMLYFRLSDPRGSKVYKVFPIGQLVSFSKPEHQLDRFSNLHVLYQMNARSFLYTLITPEGFILARETYEISNSHPVLRPGRDGRIQLTGGVRRYTPNDLPPPITSKPLTDARPPQP